MKFKQFTIMLMIFGLIFSEVASGARFGGGRSRGMQRSFTPSSNRGYYNNNYTNQSRPSYTTQNPAVGAQQPRRSMGAGTAALLGAAAGAAGGYMLGKNSNDNNQNVGNMNQNSDLNASGANVNNSNLSSTQKPIPTNSMQESNNIPWGIVIILLLLLGVGLMFFRKKADGSAFGGNNKLSGFNMPKFRAQQQEKTFTASNMTTSNIQNSMASNLNQDINNNNVKMPDGIETVYFLRQVKGMFLHIQSMNNPENLNEVAKYLTPELYQELQSEIQSNTVIADFSSLDCQLLDCEQNGNNLIASVQFSGMVSEDPTQAPIPFNEVWNFVKPDIKINKWLVAGIQHSPSNI